MPYYTVQLNTERGGLWNLTEDLRLLEARKSVRLMLVPQDFPDAIGDDAIPDYLVTDSMVTRFLEITPPLASVIPDYQTVIDEIERSYVLGLYFSALSPACVSTERLLNQARIELHPYHRKIKQLWNKGAVDSWIPNINALLAWGYLGDEFGRELAHIYSDIRCRYLHSGEITTLQADALRAIKAAYHLLSEFLGFPQPLFDIPQHGFTCLNEADPRFQAFYRPRLTENPPGD